MNTHPLLPSPKRALHSALLRALPAIVLLLLAAALAGCGTGSSNGTPPAPTNLTYPQPTITAVTGTAITPDTPTVTGTVTSYTINPTLPTGLSLNSTTGVISGTPTTVTTQATYTVTATNITGSTTTTIQITVNPAAPTNLTYPQASITAVTGTAITPDTPTVTGTVTTYTISPSLPTGLSLNSTTGAISGTPTTVTAQTTYTITATNITGSTTATIQITVNPAAPTNLVYPQTTITAAAGTAITTDIPTVTGTVTGYTISPTLPAGLTFDPFTGIISGTPTAASAETTYTVTASNASGSTTATVQISVTLAPPANLAYAFPSFIAEVGGAIPTDTPSVTGVVTSYSITPALPPGLIFDTLSGTISGAPTSASPLTTYTVTATNSAGFDTANVSIQVQLGAPQNLGYPQTSITALVGQPIATDIPYLFNTASGYSISPALPAGLSFNTSNGAISGTPTAASPQTTYTITASNSAGSTTATVSITVVSFSGFELLDLGHANPIKILRLQSSRLFSQDTSGHWVLWDYAAATQIASGDPIAWAPQSDQTAAFPSDMAGAILAIGIADGVEIRSSTDGSLITTLTARSLDPAYEGNAWWKLATDGSYIASGDSTGLYVWSTTDGHLIFSFNGDYSAANAFASPGQIQIAQGPSGPSVIETDAVPAGTSSIGPAFTGTFNTWFSDGSHFITNSAGVGSPLSYVVYIYSAAGAQQGAISSGSFSTLGGYGNWFWDAGDASLSLYAIGSTTPTDTIDGGVSASVVPSGSTLAVLPYGTPAAYVVDLSGPTPNITQSTLPIAYDGVFAATSPTQWVVGNTHGVVLDGPSASTTPRFFGYGNAFSMAGAPGSVAIATASGKILDYAPSSEALIGTIDFTSSTIAMSPDGSILAALASVEDAQYEPDRTLNIYSLPSGTVTYSFPYTLNETPGATYLGAITMSGSGNAIGLTLGTWQSVGGFAYTREETPLSGSPILWSDNPPPTYPGPGPSFFLSPDGTLVAVSTPISGIGFTSASTTTIYKNGAYVATVNGFVLGWIDNNRLLVNTFSTPYGPYGQSVYVSSVIYDATGATLATLTALPELVQYSTGFITVDSDSIYSPSTYSIYSLTTGAILWTESLPHPGSTAFTTDEVSTISGSYVVFVEGTRVLVDLP